MGLQELRQSEANTACSVAVIYLQGLNADVYEQCSCHVMTSVQNIAQPDASFCRPR